MWTPRFGVTGRAQRFRSRRTSVQPRPPAQLFAPADFRSDHQPCRLARHLLLLTKGEFRGAEQVAASLDGLAKSGPRAEDSRSVCSVATAAACDLGRARTGAGRTSSDCSHLAQSAAAPAN
eukprot:962545-Pleurochrysis_carterae.AAC.2